MTGSPVDSGALLTIVSVESAWPSRVSSASAEGMMSASSYGAADSGVAHSSVASGELPSRLQRPARWTTDDQGAASVNNTSEVMSTPASSTCVVTTIVPPLVGSGSASARFK